MQLSYSMQLPQFPIVSPDGASGQRFQAFVGDLKYIPIQLELAASLCHGRKSVSQQAVKITSRHFSWVVSNGLVLESSTRQPIYVCLIGTKTIVIKLIFAGLQRISAISMLAVTSFLSLVFLLLWNRFLLGAQIWPAHLG